MKENGKMEERKNRKKSETKGRCCIGQVQQGRHEEYDRGRGIWMQVVLISCEEKRRDITKIGG
jgi:hypothetical protein